ncbi:hypothetical protein LPC27_13525 [Paraclostridium bifermentans]|uniref:hypothetical protein n=1 Tax=Paraclostridium bifermentans TaxID=1490 RepID=UPI001F260A82|nr:hypothetical protein [Paraclostridium bifermentans]MCE9676790.1 hypothetical protein [Paraclostridium bifermentans]
MNDFNNQNGCCCSCGLKKSICILNQIKELDLIDNTTLLDVYYDSNLKLKESTLKESLYPNLILVEGKDESNNSIKINLCLEYLNAVAFKAKSNDYQSIINILNRDYYHLLRIETPCNENCCCKYSFISYFKDKYLQSNHEDRLFKLGVCGIATPIPQGTEKLVVVHLDYDIGWFLDIINATFYLVPLCKIYGVI